MSASEAGETTKGPVPAQGKLPGLHGVRGLAAMMILLYHVVWLSGAATPSYMAFAVTLASFAVQLFFVLSAFSLAASHYARPASTAAYFIKRYFRLAPLFLCVLVFKLIQHDWSGPPPAAARDWSVPFILLDASLLFGFVPGAHNPIVQGGWSVGVEMIFYMLLPVMLELCKTARTAGLMFVCTALVAYVASLAIVQIPRPRDYIMFAPIVHFACFAAGLFGYLLFKEGAFARRPLLFFGLAAVVAVCASLALAPASGLDGRVNSTAIAVLAPTFGMLCLWQAVFPNVVFTNPLAQYLADRSYGIYLLQFPTFELLRHFHIYERVSAQSLGPLTYPAVIGATLLALLPIVEVGYRLIELPGIALGRRLARGAPVTASA